MIKLGMIGMSEGNAHPYSWSAIINGFFDGTEIANVGYPAVAAYLNANKDTLGLPDARVTSVWAQDSSVAASIARATGIDGIAASLEEMAGKVDAVMLCRDDPQNHVEMARPFLENNIPIFIDKPLAANLQDLKYFKAMVDQGKFLMSCASMRYANECRIIKQELLSLGTLQLITAVGKKDWIKYGVHMLEAVCFILDDLEIRSIVNTGSDDKDIVTIEFDNGVTATIHLFKEIAPTFQLSVFGESQWRIADIKNSYSMFRDNIIEFIRSIKEGRPRLDFRKTENIIRALIAAIESRLQGGKKVFINQ